MGSLTIHVLDTANGLPAANLGIELYRIGSAGREYVKSARTGSSGRPGAPMLAEAEFATGVWEVVFHASEYFAAAGTILPAPPFLDVISLRFGMASDEQYHVALLISPWSYTTYRGS